MNDTESVIVCLLITFSYPQAYLCSVLNIMNNVIVENHIKMYVKILAIAIE